MPSTATSADVAARWRPLSTAEQSVADALLDDAWALIVHRVPDVEARIVDGTLSQSTVTMVQARMVLRVLKNPDGFRQASIDDWSYTRDQALSAGELYISDDELALVDGPSVSSEAFTISPFGKPGYSTASDGWL